MYIKFCLFIYWFNSIIVNLGAKLNIQKDNSTLSNSTVSLESNEETNLSKILNAKKFIEVEETSGNNEAWINRWPDLNHFNPQNISTVNKLTWTIITKTKTLLMPNNSFSLIQTLSSYQIEPCSSSYLTSNENQTLINLNINKSEINSIPILKTISINSIIDLQTKQQQIIKTNSLLQSSFQTDYDLLTKVVSIQNSNSLHSKIKTNLMNNLKFDLNSISLEKTPVLDLSSILKTTSSIQNLNTKNDLRGDQPPPISSEQTSFNLDEQGKFLFSNVKDTKIQITPTVTNDNFLITNKPLSTFNNNATKLQLMHQNLLISALIFKNLSLNDLTYLSKLMENRLKIVYESAYLKHHKQSASNLNVNLNSIDFKPNSQAHLIYAVQVNDRYLSFEEAKQMLNNISDNEMADLIGASKIVNKAEPFIIHEFTTFRPASNLEIKKENSILNEVYSKLKWTHFWIIICLVIFILFLGCYCLILIVCLYKKRKYKIKKLEKKLDQTDPSSPTNTLKADSKNKSKRHFVQIRDKKLSLSANNNTNNNLIKRNKKKNTGSSLSNEFEYISFSSSDTTTNSLQRDTLLSNVNSSQRLIRHHPYFDSNLYNKSTIEKPNSTYGTGTSGMKLLISRGVQSNLNDYSQPNTIEKMPDDKLYGQNVSILTISKEKLIPINRLNNIQLSSSDEDKNYDVRSINSLFVKPNLSFVSNQSKNDTMNQPILSNTSILNSTQDKTNLGKNKPTRKIRKKTIEEYETITTTTKTSSTQSKDNLIANNKQDLNLNENQTLNQAQLNEQTKIIINAIRSELKKFTPPNQLVLETNKTEPSLINKKQKITISSSNV